jgi:L-cysteine/cystine lyase
MTVNPETSQSLSFDDARSLFPCLERLAYLNAGTFGPLAQATMDAVEREQRRDLHEARAGAAWYAYTTSLRASARAAIARLVGVQPESVALTASTTDGCNIVLAGLGLTAQDEVVTTSAEHFGLLGALGASPARVVVVEPDPESILAAVTPRTRLIAVSEVLWTTGAVLPIAELRVASGIPVLADGAQSVGAIDVDAGAVDFLTISGQKWLCGPDPTGALVVRDPERLAVARPSSFGQAGYEPDGTFAAREGALRFEPNWIGAGALAGLVTAVELRPPWALPRAAEQAARLRGLLSPHVELVTPDNPSTIVSFRPPPATTAAELVDRLAEAAVIVREIPRTGLVRASGGWWTDDTDLDRLVAGVSV